MYGTLKQQIYRRPRNSLLTMLLTFFITTAPFESVISIARFDLPKIVDIIPLPYTLNIEK